ncbi:hypothetical protein MMC26_005885 [Xylographa opegraphella]|nr:hypothetical protein [Xylographa opegraphella]
MLYIQTTLVLVLAVANSLAYSFAELQHAQRAINAESDGLAARAIEDRMLLMREVISHRRAFARDINSYEDARPLRRSKSLSPYIIEARTARGGGGGGAKSKGRGGASVSNNSLACKFCKDKKGADGKPCAYNDIVAPLGVDKSKFDTCRRTLELNPGVNPEGMGAVSAGGGAGGAAAIAITNSITADMTKKACAGVMEAVHNAVSTGGGQC